MEECGHSVDTKKRQYHVVLKTTSPLMWNTPPDGPFYYETSDPANPQLWTQIPLRDEAVLDKLSRIRQLKTDEPQAVRDLYLLPRIDLATFAFIFSNFAEADRCLIQEGNEKERWAYFQRQFALFHKRCGVIAEHLTCHVAEATEQKEPDDPDVAWCLLKHLFADENWSLSPSVWESDDGKVPAVTWEPQPNGSAFAALLGLVGTGVLGEYTPDGGSLLWREVRGPLSAFGSELNEQGSPIPTILPFMGLTRSQDQMRFVSLRNGFALWDPNGEALGSAQGFTICWRGALLIEKEGRYKFFAGAPTQDGEKPDFEEAEDHQWRVIIKKGQKTWAILSHHWPDEVAPKSSSTPIQLKPGAYQLRVQFAQKQPTFSEADEIHPQETGFQLKYCGPDSDDRIIAIPMDKLFFDEKDQTLSGGIVDQKQGDATISILGVAKSFLDSHYISTLRDIRRTYQRAFKALLFAHRFCLSAKPIADDIQSEIGYMLAHASDLMGTSFYRNNGGYSPHHAYFDFNFLPVLDYYHPPMPAQDQRVHPSVKREQALFDWWERIFDYTLMRREACRTPEHPVWLLFHEAAESHPDEPAQLLRHMGVDLRHDALVLNYYLGQQNNVITNYTVINSDLEDERWPIRIWQAEKWIQALLWNFTVRDIRDAQPYLWAADDPGDYNLTRFVRDGCLENGDPQRYEDIERLNNCLRERARQALLAYLCGMKRIALPWSDFAEEPRDLSDMLLLDVEAGLCERASRIEEAITAVQTFVQRCRLSLDPGFTVSPKLARLWDYRFVTFCRWEACKCREIYHENWIDWSELEKAQRSEAFRFLEDQLRRATLTVPVSGNLEYWPDERPHIHSGLTLLQKRDPALMQQPSRTTEGFNILGTPERDARPSWLSAVDAVASSSNTGVSSVVQPSASGSGPLPFWIESAIRLGTRFIRVAAAGVPPASTGFGPRHSDSNEGCCAECGRVNHEQVDEYYFWLIDTRYFKEIQQDADWHSNSQPPRDPENPESDLHDPTKLPQLLLWESDPMVHLAWCRVHNGEFQQPRRSDEGVRIAGSSKPELTFLGRSADSLNFEVAGGDLPTGYSSPPNPGFRYDIAADLAVVLPLVTPAPPRPGLGNLSAYPYFAYFYPGDRLMPLSLFSPAIAVGEWLRAHCRFEAALKWYQLVFDPLHEDSTWCLPVTVDVPAGQPIAAAQQPAGGIDSPCCQSSSGGLNIPEYVLLDRAIILHYLETLLQWGDALMCCNSPEAFQQARLIFDTAAKILGERPCSILAVDTTKGSQTVTGFQPNPAPLNPRLMALYDLIGDRLELIHVCMNARRLCNSRPDKSMPYWGDLHKPNSWQVNPGGCQGWKFPSLGCMDDEDWCCHSSPYRFTILAQKAQEMANEVRGLGAALLAAFEKGDAEYLASLRAGHERQMLSLAHEIRQNQWREADWQAQALQKTKEGAQTRKRYYEKLIHDGLNTGERAYPILTAISLGCRTASTVSSSTAGALKATPDTFVGVPCSFAQLPTGTKASGITETIALISNVLAEYASTGASLALTFAGWDRRDKEWRHLVEVTGIEIEQIERQILAAERRRDIALRELNNHQLQIEQSIEVQDFLRDKFTSAALYLYLQKETAALHFRMYELALSVARQAQRAFNYERGHTAHRFLPSETWDNLHEGLLVGERLQLAVHQMEKAYMDENVREYELTKDISLRLHFPLAFLNLRATGHCEIEIPEWMFDLDYPGQYMRRIKNVTLTIPCVIGPYTVVHCRLTLLCSATRADPRLIAPPAHCCEECRSDDGYVALPDDPRIINLYAATEAIATSSGQNDSGMFELSFRDERYLPFEFAGAVSRWRIELPPENNPFDMDTLSDVILHINYTAREGGELLRRAANEIAQQHLPGDCLKFFDIRHDFPDAWPHIKACSGEEMPPRRFDLQLSRSMFPFVPIKGDLWVTRLELFFKAEDAEPGSHRVIKFLTGHEDKHAKEDENDCEVKEIDCVASAEWPCLYHGVLDIQLGPLCNKGCRYLGTFLIPVDIGEISDAFMFCGYAIHECEPECKKVLSHRPVPKKDCRCFPGGRSGLL